MKNKVLLVFCHALVLFQSTVYSIFIPPHSTTSLPLDPIPPRFFKMEVRDRFVELCQERGFKYGVEVGVQNGNFAVDNLKIWTSVQNYYLVDMWQRQENYKDTANVEEDAQEKIYQTALANMKPFGDKPILIRNSSVNASLLFPDLSLDFVYLDARHDYCGVTEDLVAWFPKLKKGGIMSGHDFMTDKDAFDYSGGKEHWEVCGNGSIVYGAVKKAVIDFATLHKTKVHQMHSTWYYGAKGIEHHGPVF